MQWIIVREERFNKLIGEKLKYTYLTEYFKKTVEDVINTGVIDEESKKKLITASSIGKKLLEVEDESHRVVQGV